MPVVADILAIHPHAQIDWVVEEAFAPLVARLDGVRRVIPIAMRRWRKSWFAAPTRQECATFLAHLQSVTYDVIIDGQGLIKSACVARVARLAVDGKCGSFANKSQTCSYEWPVKFLLPHNQIMPMRIHAVARTRLLTAKLLDYEARTDIWQSFARVTFEGLPAHRARSKKIMFAHGTTRLDNEWAFGHWLDLAAKFLSEKWTVILPCSTDREYKFCQDLQAIEGPGGMSSGIEILPRMQLPQVLNEMATCEGVIGVDSGLSHMAVALGLPHVQLFSQDRAWRAGPVPVEAGGAPYQVAVGGAHAPSVDVVWQAWLSVNAASKECSR